MRIKAKLNESMTAQPGLANRFALSSLLLAAVSGVLWFAIEGPLPINIDDIDPDGYTYVVAVFSGVFAGLIAISTTVTRRVKGRRNSKSMNTALLFGLPALGWNAFVW